MFGNDDSDSYGTYVDKEVAHTAGRALIIA
jgi:hypothetical protein